MGMVTKPMGMPAAAKTRPASSVPASLPSGVTVPSKALMGGSARSRSSPPATARAIAHGDLRELRLDDRHGLHVLAGVGDRQVELVQAAHVRGAVLRAHRRPAEVDLGHARRRRARWSPRRRAVVPPLLAALEVVDLDAAAVGGDQRALAGDEGRRGSGAERHARRRQADEPPHQLGRQRDARAVDVRPLGGERGARRSGRDGDADLGQHLERRGVEPFAGPPARGWPDGRPCRWCG